jgi:DNA polymerase-3 subunit alpha
MIAFQTAYLKAHYPVQFMAALLTLDMGNQDKTIKNIAECGAMGIEILPPDVNESQADFSVVDGKIRFGLAAVKNVGMKAVELVIEERDRHGPFGDLLDFCRRVDGSKVNRRVLEGLIQCGAFDFTGEFRSRLFAGLDDALRICGANHDPNQLNIFGLLPVQNGGARGLLELPDILEWSKAERLRREKEGLGFYITGHPLDSFREEIDRFANSLVQDLPIRKDKTQVKIAGVVESVKLKRTKRGDKMAVIQLEDLTGSTEVVIFPDVFAAVSPLLKGDDPLLVTGSVEIGETAAKVIAKEVERLSDVRLGVVKSILVLLENGMASRETLENLRDIVFKYPGESRLLFKVGVPEGEPLMISAHGRFNVAPCRGLLTEMEELLGYRAWELL